MMNNDFYFVVFVNDGSYAVAHHRQNGDIVMVKIAIDTKEEADTLVAELNEYEV